MRRLAEIWAGMSRRDIWFAVLSVVMTALIMIGFLVESRWGYLPPDPKLIYVDNWNEGRTRTEAAREQAKRLAEQRRQLAELRAAQAEAERAAARAQ